MRVHALNGMDFVARHLSMCKLQGTHDRKGDKIMNRYHIYYRGMLAETCLTLVKAKARAFELATEKQWPISDIKIVDMLQEVSKFATGIKK